MSEVRDMYENMALQSNPVYQIMNSMPDEMIKEMFPDMEEKEARTLIGKLALFGGIKMNADGSFDVDQELWDKLLNGEDGDGTGDDDDDQTGEYTYNDYKADAEKAGDTNILSRQEWRDAGWKKYVTPVDESQQFQDIINSLDPNVEIEGIDQDLWKYIGKKDKEELTKWLNNETNKELVGYHNTVTTLDPYYNELEEMFNKGDEKSIKDAWALIKGVIGKEAAENAIKYNIKHDDVFKLQHDLQTKEMEKAKKKGETITPAEARKRSEEEYKKQAKEKYHVDIDSAEWNNWKNLTDKNQADIIGWMIREKEHLGSSLWQG